MQTTVLPIYEGIEAARAAILASRREGSVTLPEAVAARVREVFGEELTAEQVVARVVQDVRAEGDEAVLRYAAAFDRANTSSLRVDEAEIDAALAAVSPALIEALQVAAARLRAFHERARRNSWLDFQGD